MCDLIEYEVKGDIHPYIPKIVKLDKGYVDGLNKDIDKAIRDIDAAYKKLEDLYDGLSDEISRQIGQRVCLETSDWECEKSPIGVCCFDVCSDTDNDTCVFCGEPDERK